MKSFTMKEITMKPYEPGKPGAIHELGRDESGRLYSVHMRQLLDPMRTDTSVIEAMAALRIAGKMMHHLQERWAEKHGLSEGRLGVLFRLYRCGPTPLGDLASDLDSTPRNITGLVDHLEKDALVERFPDPEDRRAIRVRLAPIGKQKLSDIKNQIGSPRHGVVAGFTDEELNQLRHLLLKLVRNMNASKELEKV